MNKQTRALSEEQYFEMIRIMKEGFTTKEGKIVKPNNRIAIILILEANLFCRLSDILALKLSSIVRDGNRYRLEIVEQKTRKKRQFTVADQIYNFILEYAITNNIKKDEPLFDISARQVQKVIQYAADHMGLECIGSHSFRKYASTQVYLKEKDIFLLKELLQHASVSTTQRYINIDSKIERVLEEHIKLPS